MATRQSLQNFGQAFSQGIEPILAALIAKRQEDEFNAALEQSRKALVNPSAGAANPSNYVLTPENQPAAQPDVMAVLANILSGNPGIVKNPNFAPAFNAAQALAPKYEYGDTTKDLMEMRPGREPRVIRQGQPKVEDVKYRAIVNDDGGPTYVIQNGIISEKRQGYRGDVPVKDAYEFKKVGDAEAKEIARASLELSRKRLALAQRQGDETAYRFWQQQVDEWDKYVMELGQKATDVGQSTLTPEQQQVIVAKLNADIESGKIKADYAREIANSLNVKFTPKGETSKPKTTKDLRDGW